MYRQHRTKTCFESPLEKIITYIWNLFLKIEIPNLELDSYPDHNKGPTHNVQVLRLIPFLDPNHTNWHDLCLEVLTLHYNELRLFVAITLLLLLILLYDIASVGPSFNIFSYNDIWERASNSSPFRKPSRCATCYATDAGSTLIGHVTLHLTII